MSLPKLEVVNFIPGLKLKLRSTASEKTVKDLLGCSSVHDEDLSPIKQVRSCSECGEINPTVALITPEGLAWCREKPEHPYFDVQGYTSCKNVTPDLVRDTYFVEVDSGDKATGNFCKALGRRIGLLGYIRTTVNSDERVGFLYSPESGVLVLKVLYYLDTEATEPIKVVAEPKSYTTAAARIHNRILDTGIKTVADLTRREYTYALAQLEKEVSKQNKPTKERNADDNHRKASK